MEEKIKELYSKLSFIGMIYLNSGRVGNIEAVMEYMPQISEFVNWFVKENIFGIEDNLYQGLCGNLLDIVNDIMQANQNNDRVLMHDAVQYGLVEFLEMFIESGDEVNGSVW